MADHLIIAPVVLPLVAGAGMLLLDERRRSLKAAINVASTFALVGIAIALLVMSDTADDPAAARSAFTGSATGRRRSGSCSSWTACRPSCCC